MKPSLVTGPGVRGERLGESLAPPLTLATLTVLPAELWPEP